MFKTAITTNNFPKGASILFLLIWMTDEELLTLLNHFSVISFNLYFARVPFKRYNFKNFHKCSKRFNYSFVQSRRLRAEAAFLLTASILKSTKKSLVVHVYTRIRKATPFMISNLERIKKCHRVAEWNPNPAALQLLVSLQGRKDWKTKIWKHRWSTLSNFSHFQRLQITSYRYSSPISANWNWYSVKLEKLKEIKTENGEKFTSPLC